MADLLALADPETAALWRDLRLGYTEAPGHPLLRAEIATLYDTIAPDEVLVFSGAEEAIFITANVVLGPGDHAIVAWPAYQSLHEVARATGADVTLHELREGNGWAIDIEDLRAQVTPRTKLIVLNVPQQPDGLRPGCRHVPGRRGNRRRCRRHAPVRRGVPLPRARRGRPPPGRRGSRSPGCERGRDEQVVRAGRPAHRLARDATMPASSTAPRRFKDYTTICASAPAEILSLIALRARDLVLARSRAIVDGNLTLLDAFFERRAGQVSWVRPRGGPRRLPRDQRRPSRRPFRPGPAGGRGRPDRARLDLRTPRQQLPPRLRATDLPVALAGLEVFMDRPRRVAPCPERGDQDGAQTGTADRPPVRRPPAHRSGPSGPPAGAGGRGGTLGVRHPHGVLTCLLARPSRPGPPPVLTARWRRSCSPRSLAGCGVLPSGESEATGVVGEGDVQTEIRELPPFTRVSVAPA